jgi:flagellar biosynthesis/type III secretory pathway chaperone
VEKNLEPIFQALSQLTGLHRQLLDLVRTEREALIAADLKVIQDVTVAKQGLIESIAQAESARLKSVGDLAMLWKRPFRELTLPNLIIAIQGDDAKSAEQLRSTYNTLTVLVRHISEQNEANRALVEKSLRHVDEMKRNVLGEADPKAATYTAHGQRTPSTAGARLLSREA